MTSTPKNPVQLSGTLKGQTVKLIEIQGGRGLRQRLSAMGLILGQEIIVISNGHPGPFILKVKESKIVLGRGMTDKILVNII